MTPADRLAARCAIHPGYTEYSVATPVHGFTLHADRVADRWDVYLRYETGARVPPGPNVHDDVGAEGQRLVAALTGVLK